MRAFLIVFAILLATAGSAAAQTPCDHGGNKMAMWQSIQNHCIDHPDANSPKDCVLVDDHIVIARDAFKPHAFLVVARDEVCGIESDSVRAPDAPNYFAAGWAHRDLVGADWTVGLAINAQHKRSQNRLHIHLDRLCPEVADALATADVSKPFALPLLAPYRALAIKAADLPHLDIFDLVAKAEPKVAHGDESIALVASKADPAAAIVLYGADGTGGGHAEDLFSYGGRCKQ